MSNFPAQLPAQTDIVTRHAKRVHMVARQKSYGAGRIKELETKQFYNRYQGGCMGWIIIAQHVDKKVISHLQVSVRWGLFLPLDKTRFDCWRVIAGVVN